MFSIWKYTIPSWVQIVFFESSFFFSSFSLFSGSSDFSWSCENICGGGGQTSCFALHSRTWIGSPFLEIYNLWNYSCLKMIYTAPKSLWEYQILGFKFDMIYLTIQTSKMILRNLTNSVPKFSSTFSTTCTTFAPWLPNTPTWDWNLCVYKIKGIKYYFNSIILLIFCLIWALKFISIYLVQFSQCIMFCIDIFQFALKYFLTCYDKIRQ